MTAFTARTALRAATIVAAMASLTACNALTRMSEVGSGPQISAIQNPTQKAGYQPVTMPMPNPVAPPQNANSLWRPGSRAFFKDQRAKEIGDILTVAVSIDESASFETTLERKRDADESTGITNLMGFENSLKKVLPDTVNPAALLGATGTSNNTNS
ncbi:MAG TPA: flagellar basal body L-ring protein FlgH, partial [Candidatus Omnitrophota bacterium]|nr:flagellar basal body L-ring protein FlgH [Candidatus Omnitrophota bacterium]